MTTRSERPHTADLCTTIAMVFSANHHVSGGWKSEVDLIPVFDPDR